MGGSFLLCNMVKPPTAPASQAGGDATHYDVSHSVFPLPTSTTMSSSSPPKAPLPIEDKAHNDQEEGVTSIEVGGIAVKLDKLGPM